MGTQVELQMVKINSNLKPKKVLELEELLREYKDVFVCMYKDLKGISSELAQHRN
jgi:hypothetical protein